MTDEELKRWLVALLTWESAHVGFERAVSSLPADRVGARPQGHAHSLWELVEHLRLAQRDILEFSRTPGHVSPPWPDSYWPPSPEPPSPSAWQQSVDAFRADLTEFCALLESADSDPFAPFPWDPKKSLLREALLLADHNAYHVGQIVAVRHALALWPPPR
ncbi:MAG: DinB family protein [Thermoanaerobaculia bacterium]